MKFPTFSRSTATSPGSVAASSKDSSLTDPEKPTSRHPSISSQASVHQDEIITTALKEAKALDKLSDEPVYPSGAKLAIITASLCLSVFCMALVCLNVDMCVCGKLMSGKDNTIIATAIPKITDDFKTIDDIGWYGSGQLMPSS